MQRIEVAKNLNPNCVIIDKKYDVVHFSGRHTRMV